MSKKRNKQQAEGNSDNRRGLFKNKHRVALSPQANYTD
jgi:hypothetical protein